MNPLKLLFDINAVVGTLADICEDITRKNYRVIIGENKEGDPKNWGDAPTEKSAKASGREVKTGPRGGKYYETDSGNRVYLK